MNERNPSTKLEIEALGARWVEGENCPVKVAGIPCDGVLKKIEGENGVGLECSTDSYYHNISVREAPVGVKIG